MKATTIERTSKNENRKADWKNIGYAVSMGLLIMIVIPSCVWGTIELVRTGHNPLTDKYCGLFCFDILIASWNAIRNSHGPIEYIRSWYQNKYHK